MNGNFRYLVLTQNNINRISKSFYIAKRVIGVSKMLDVIWIKYNTLKNNYNPKEYRQVTFSTSTIRTIYDLENNKIVTTKVEEEKAMKEIKRALKILKKLGLYP